MGKHGLASCETGSRRSPDRTDKTVDDGIKKVPKKPTAKKAEKAKAKSDAPDDKGSDSEAPKADKPCA